MYTQAEKPVTKSEVQEIVDSLAASINSAFTDQQKQIFRLEEKMDAGFARVDEKFEEVNMKINGVNNRIDDIATNYTRRDEHKKLEKRVEKLEVSFA